MWVSTSQWCGGAVLASGLLAGPSAGCGWHVGAPPIAALSVARVESRSAEPGLAAALEGGLVRALRRRGVAAGAPALIATVTDTTEHADSAGAFVRSAELHLTAVRDDRPGCAVTASGRRTFAAADADTLLAARTAAWDRLAAEVTDRLVDGLLAEAACR